MPIKKFSGVYRLVDKEWGGRKALRLRLYVYTFM